VEHIFCEIDPFCQQVLKKHWKGATVYGDIRQLVTDTESYRCERGIGKSLFKRESDGATKSGKNVHGKVDLLTGGFPCQPFSQAGKRRGTSDDRFLWPEMCRVIRDFKPTWVIAENVRGILTIEQGMVFEQVCLDLEAAGYEVQAFIIPAVAVNAPHRRDRVWIVANSQSVNADGKRGQQNSQQQDNQKIREGFLNESCGSDSDAPDTTRSGEQGFNDRQGKEQFRRSSWEQDWLTVASRICVLDDGLPAELDGFKLSKAGHRVERLKSLGNAIVPQVAIEIMKAIRKVEDEAPKTD
jgi:DNA (cytosine-5)-methyltransferase 1